MGKERNHRAGPGPGPGLVQTGWPLLRAALDPGSPVAPRLEGTGRGLLAGCPGHCPWAVVPMYGLGTAWLVDSLPPACVWCGEAAGMHLTLKTSESL